MNIYIQIIKDLSHQNKYLNWYIGIVENAQIRAKTKKKAKEIINYAVEHHIVLESFFKERVRNGPCGDVEGNSKSKENLVFLTPKEHLCAHKCLSKCLKSQMHIAKNANAICRMLQSKPGTHKISSREYDRLMKHFIDNNPGKTKEAVLKIKQTKLERYGDENYSNFEKQKETVLERYGVEHYSKTETYLEDFTNTMLERYGVEHALQIPESKEKFVKTCLENNGVEYPMQSKEIQQKSIETRLEKYGVEYNMQSEILREKSKQTWIEKYGVDNPGKRMINCKYCGEYKNINHQSKCKLNPDRTLPGCKIVTCKYCGEQKTVNHQTKCKLNPERKLQDISGDKNPNRKK
jgi:hypothetical protein